MHTKYSKLNYRSLAKEHPTLKEYPPLRFDPMFCIGSMFTCDAHFELLHAHVSEYLLDFYCPGRPAM